MTWLNVTLKGLNIKLNVDAKQTGQDAPADQKRFLSAVTSGDTDTCNPRACDLSPFLANGPNAIRHLEMCRA